MMKKGLYLVLFLSLISVGLAGQNDEDPPDPPLFTFVTLNPANNLTEMTWTRSLASDVAGYVIYLFKDREGYAIDTIFNPLATSYSVFRPGNSYYSESYVIAAIDYSDNISPLSNELHTIHISVSPDTCNNNVKISWNKYLSVPAPVARYDIFSSVNSGAYYLAGQVSENTTEYIVEDITSGSEYCFIVKAILGNGLSSVSNKGCVNISLQRPPSWINADYATVNEDNKISLSFSIDPLSETDLFRLERKQGFLGLYQQAAVIRSTDAEKILHTDENADLNNIYFYRLAAVNNCDVATVYSNPATNLSLKNTVTDDKLVLDWNSYRKWEGEVESYKIYADKGDGYTLLGETQDGDTTYFIRIPDIMYTLKEGRICFYVEATETGNPYGISGISRSNTSCTDINENVTVPDIFTPDGDLRNDLFRPVITFSPVEYRLLITDRLGRVLFETLSFMESWDGSDTAGKAVNEGVYLWFLKIKTPGGRNISRTGTVTVLIR